MRLHRISLGQATNAAQSFADPTDLMNYCAGNPDSEAGYAPSGQNNPQVLPCQEWPSLFPGYAASATCYDSSGNVIACGSTISVTGSTVLSDFSTWLTETAIDSIPNWVLALGLAVAAWWFMKKQGRGL